MDVAEATLVTSPAGPGPTRAGRRAGDRPEPPRGRRWLLGFWALAFVAFLVRAPGRMTFETKLGVVADPFGFLHDLGTLWQDRGGFGGIADQYIGYAFPTLPYYALAHLARLPVWLAERLWMSLIVAAAFWGALRLAERLRVGSPATRLLGAVGYALWPTFTIVIGSTAAAALPGAVLPWVLLPLASRTSGARTAAARSALLVPFMGGVNAASTLAALLPVALYLLSRPRGRRQRALLAWWIPGVVLATAWWTVPLLLLGHYGENFMPYIEQADTTTATMSATELLRGAGNWVAYLNFGEPWLPAGWAAATALVAIIGSGLAAALGLAGLARRDLPERRWLLLTVLSVVLIALAGYGGAYGAPFHATVQGWLDGWLRPFRNIYKFQPGLALALAFGLAHLTAVAAERRGARHVPGRRLAPALAALLLLPGLAWPYLNGTVLQPGSFTKLPAHWSQTADWLKKHSPDSRALVVPATAHGIYTWGSPIDQPLDVLAESRWAQRDYVPFGTPGSRRAMDAVEQALMTGTEVPGLRDYLGRAGLFNVVVRNDLDPDQIGYVPPQTVRRTLEASGYRRVAAFGPLLTGGRIPAETPVQVQGIYPRQQAVEIYEPVGTPRPGPVTAKPVSGTAVVSGGPETLLPLSADPSLRGRPTVLTGDNHPGIGTPPLQAVGDGLRRADTRFGLVNTNTSYTYGPEDRNPPDALQDAGRPPKQILPVDGVRHQTTAVLRGAASVTASSSGNWLFQLPQYDPVNAFDGDPNTAWAEGTPGRPVGQWLRVGFDTPTAIPASIQVTPLPGDGTRAAPTLVRVQTDKGSAESPLQPNGLPQPVKAPAGQANWLKVTILDAQDPKPGLSGAGFSEIAIPGVQVARLLKLPTDAQDSDATSETYALHRGSDPGGLSPTAAEAGLHRRFTTAGTSGTSATSATSAASATAATAATSATSGTSDAPGASGVAGTSAAPGASAASVASAASAAESFSVSASALPVPGDALDRLLDLVAPGSRRRLTATADSTARTGNALSARNLVDGDLTTAWIAGDRPVIHLRWPGRRSIDSLVLAAAGGISTRPEQILINSPYGAATAGVDENGQARFEPIVTDQLDITISKVAPLTVHNPIAGRQLQLPVGLSEVYVPALDDLRTPAPAPSARFSLPCGQGPALAVDGTLHATKAAGRVRDLTERRPVKVELCGSEARRGALPLRPGAHTVEAGDQGPLALTDVTLTRGKAPAPAAARPTKALDWAGDHRSVHVDAGQAAYLQTYENANSGWHATLNGKRLAALRMDGWQQGFLIPAGQGGTVKLSYAPSTTYDAALIGGAAGIVLLALLAVVRRRPLATPPPPPPAPGWLLGTVALTAVLVVVAGPVAVVAPVLALIARARPWLLVPTALLAMTGAMIAATTGAGDPAAMSEGPFGGAAQVLAVTALAAAVVTLPRGSRQRARPGPAAEPPAAPPAPKPEPPPEPPAERA